MNENSRQLVYVVSSAVTALAGVLFLVYAAEHGIDRSPQQLISAVTALGGSIGPGLAAKTLAKQRRQAPPKDPAAGIEAVLSQVLARQNEADEQVKRVRQVLEPAANPRTHPPVAGSLAAQMVERARW